MIARARLALLASLIFSLTATIFAAADSSAASASTPPGFSNVQHIIIAMQENHSFDNYLGVLGLVPGGPYHAGAGACSASDHACVNGLSCTRNAVGAYTCKNSNPDNPCTRYVDPSTQLVTYYCLSGASQTATVFHTNNYCPAPDLDHGWESSHHEGNLQNPDGMLKSSPNNGFVTVNDATEQTDSGPESANDDPTIGFYNESDLPFYYGLAETFAIDDNYHAAVIGPTFPNRSYLMTATSFGHLDTNEEVPPASSGTNLYQPITGTIFDLLDKQGITWTDYYTDLPQAGSFRVPVPPHFAPIAQFFADVQTGNLPQVVLLDPELLGVTNTATDEHPPHDIRYGQFYMSQIVSALRNSNNWASSILFITYDEHGGAYDHAAPPPAAQGGKLNPDGINPGQCEDLSNPPASKSPGGGANCSSSQTDAANLCPGFGPTGSYPAACANFNQLGFRVPFIVVSPFSKAHYVSHTVGTHTSLLKVIELRFLSGNHLTLRDQYSDPLFDLFDFVNAPSKNVDLASLPAAPVPNVVTDGNGSCVTVTPSVPSP
jgi:phospholipase C